MQPRILRRIFWANVRIMVLGGSLAAFFGWTCVDVMQGPPPYVINTGVISIAIVGACVFVAGMAFALVPAIDPGVRALRRYGHARNVAREIDSELSSAQVLYKKIFLTSHWLAFLGRLSVYAVRREHLMIAFRRNTPDDRSHLVLGDIHGVEVSLTLDGFEITRILDALRKACPSTVFAVDDTVYAKWRDGTLKKQWQTPDEPQRPKS